MLGHGGTEGEPPVAVAGSSVLWLQAVGGNSVIDTLRVTAPGHQSRFESWGDDDYFLGSGPRLGGMASDGTKLVYSLYVLTSLERKSDACYERGICHWKVTGGSTFLVKPGSLSRRRILPPATAVAIHGTTVAAAVLTPGSRYTGKAQIVLLDISDGSRRALGKPADVAQLLLDGDRLAAVIAHRTGPSLRVWNLKSGRLISAVRLPPSTKLKHFALAGRRIVLQAFPGFQGILSVDIHTGKAKVVERSRSNGVYGPWLWRSRVVWVEQTYGRHAGSVVRSAALP